MNARGDILREAAEAIAALADDIYPTDIFGEALTAGEWVTVREAIRPVTLDRLSADIVRTGYAMCAGQLRGWANEADDEETP